MSETIALWWKDGAPDRLVWHGQRWRVSDTPTRLTATPDFIPAALTHAPERTVGWRFQATADDGQALVLDIATTNDQWAVIHTWN